MNHRTNNLAWTGLATGAWFVFLLTLAGINYAFDAGWTVLELMGGALLASIPNLLLFAFQWRMCWLRIEAVLVLQRRASMKGVA